MYSMPGKISVLVVADESRPASAQLVTFVSNQQSDPRAFIDACLLAMQTWSQKRNEAEIAAAFKILFSAPLENNLPRSVQLGDIKYTLNDFMPGALAFVAADAALP